MNLKNTRRNKTNLDSNTEVTYHLKIQLTKREIEVLHLIFMGKYNAKTSGS